LNYLVPTTAHLPNKAGETGREEPVFLLVAELPSGANTFTFYRYFFDWLLG